MKAVVSRFQDMQDTIVRTVMPSAACFANVLQPWGEVSNEVQAQIGMIWLLGYAAPDRDTHDAVNEAKRLFNTAEAAWTGRSDLFALVKAAADKGEELDPESARWVQVKLQDFTNAGHGSLAASVVQQYLRGRSRIDEMREQYSNNLTSERCGLWFAEEDLCGVPETEIQKWKLGEESNEGKRFVPFANGGLKTVLAHAHKSTTREKMYLGNDAKVPGNVHLFREVICLRDSQARLLGYSNHAAFRIQNRAVKSVQYVEDFLNRLRESLVPRGREELRHLQILRIKDLKMKGIFKDGDDKCFPPWHLSYYKRIMSLEVRSDEAKVSQFFPLGPTVVAMLGVFESFLRLRFAVVQPDELDRNSVWHDDVQVWEAWDGENNEFVGFLYFDLLWRENKYRGSQNANIQCGYLRPDGTRQFPATTLMCSFPIPTESTCALLKHSEVVTLFHELGHGIHDLVSRTKYVRFHGTRLPVDFGETPSILLENWCWIKDIIKELSCHYTALDPQYLTEWRRENPGEPDPPEKIPDSLIESIIRSRDMHRGLYHLHQLTVSVFDLKIHNPATHEDIVDLDFQKLWYDLREEIEGIDFSRSRDQGHEHVTFSHLLNGYDMGYYGYLSCNAFAQDVFHSFFVESPRSREVWKRYRKGILEFGGSHPDQIKMLEDFLGREPDFDSLGRSLAM